MSHPVSFCLACVRSLVSQDGGVLHKELESCVAK